MELWIPLTIAAAFLQNLRSMMQKHLKGRLSTLGAAYVRFLYGLPIALAYFAIVLTLEQSPPPAFGYDFLFYAVLGGTCQVLFTVFLLWLFSFHNFAVGTTMSKLETVMVAIFGLVLLGDPLSDDSWSVRVQYKPLIRFIWLGCLLMALGGLLAATDRRYRVPVPERAREGRAVEAT